MATAARLLSSRINALVRCIPYFALVMGMTAESAYAGQPPSGLTAPMVVERAQQTHTLALTGQAVRRKFFFDIYDLKHYRLNNEPSLTPSGVFQEILSGESPQIIRMVFMRDLKAEQIQNALSEGVQRNCVDGEYEAVAADLADFRAAINQDVKKDDAFEMHWWPDGQLISRYQGDTISEIESPLLARLLWTMWFGEYAVVDRNALVQHIVQMD